MLYKFIGHELSNYFIKTDDQGNLILVNSMIGINSIYREYKLNGDELFIELFNDRDKSVTSEVRFVSFKFIDRIIDMKVDIEEINGVIDKLNSFYEFINNYKNGDI